MLRTLFLKSIIPCFSSRGDAPGYIIKPRWGEGTSKINVFMLPFFRKKDTSPERAIHISLGQRPRIDNYIIGIYEWHNHYQKELIG